MSVQNIKIIRHDEEIRFLDVVMDRNRFEVIIKQKPVYLTFTEFKLLEYLICNVDRAVSREELLKEIWSIPETIETRATDDMIKRLRKKIKAAGSDACIVTVRGFGFMIAKCHDPASPSKKMTVPKSELAEVIDTICTAGKNSGSQTVTFKIKKLDDQYVINVLS
jgi:DNA-binding winged helix-turn-helix (wHTH) protein